MSESLPPLARDMLALFENELHGQRFGDVDESSLRELADVLAQHASRVEEARLALEAVRAEHDVARSVLLARAQQSLAYARIYAESRGESGAELLAHLEALSSKPKSRAKNRRPRTKKPKAAPESAETELPFAAAS